MMFDEGMMIDDAILLGRKKIEPPLGSLFTFDVNRHRLC